MTDKWTQIKEANDLIETRNLKGKDYAEVKERVIAFRRVYPGGQILTELNYTDYYVYCEASAHDDNGVLLAKGHARELLKREFAIEVAETSAIGRALGFCGFGISTSIASAEDMEQVGKPSEIFDERPIQEVLGDFTRRFSRQEQIDLLNCLHLVEASKIPVKLLEELIKYKDEQKHLTDR